MAKNMQGSNKLIDFHRSRSRSQSQLEIPHEDFAREAHSSFSFTYPVTYHMLSCQSGPFSLRSCENVEKREMSKRGLMTDEKWP